MLRIKCPICGLRDETEFTYGADAIVRRPDMDETNPQDWLNYVFYRDDPKGPHKEYWHHVGRVSIRACQRYCQAIKNPSFYLFTDKTMGYILSKTVILIYVRLIFQS